ncbi:TonB-linked outer membrane protein, SusC/RagA family [Sunxiuqinia elliptica]|uniref:TonB-linked outer membrane protein, SusC/RagA family n=2 Tax=Sunxiuqinia elliptica TaxID=655355 RepID=A0A1I2I7T6_9BACT|nr:TonB-linked outer membrane protein, SusC/RagA family [Sunxiuqinia elliptica]
MKKNWFFKKHRYLLSYAGKILRVMKLTTFLTILTSLQLLAVDNFAQTQRLSLNVSNESIQNVLEIIENETDYFFFYNSQGISLDKRVSLNLSEKSISDVLNSLFEGENISYTISNRQIILAGNEFQALQQRKVTGKVTDASGEPLPGVTVLVKGTTQGTVTDFDGNYTIADVSAGATLVFSFVGMRTQEVAVGGHSVMNVIMEEDAVGVDEVIVVGYSVQKKSTLTGAVSPINVDDMKHRRVAELSQALQGQVAGVQVTQSTGAPGDEINIRIRGDGTIGSNTPLYIVDGVPTRELNFLNPSDIQSMTVLKDASAAAIYGSRASAGVIIVTTKVGEKGKSAFDVNYFHGVQHAINLPDMLNTEQYLNTVEKAWNNAGYEGTNPYVADRGRSDFANTDWLDEVFEAGYSQNIQLTASGGNEKLQYLLSAGYYDQDGIVVFDNDKYQRYNFRTNINADLTDRISVGTNVQLSYAMQDKLSSKGDRPGIIRHALLRPPVIPVYKSPDDPTYTERDPYTDLPFYKHNNRDTGGWESDKYEWTQNPVALAYFTNDKRSHFKTFGNLYGEVALLKDKSLRARTNVGIDLNFTHNKAFFRNFGDDDGGGNEVDKGSGRQNRPNGLNEDRGEALTISWNNTLNYNKSFDKHSVSVLLGSEFITNYSSSLNASRRRYEYDTEKFQYIDFGSTELDLWNGGTGSEWSLLSFFASATYVYNSRYMLTANLRADASSRFAEDNQWGYFPSLSAGWKMSEESFMENIDWLSDLKLRASYGKLGNQEIDNYAYLTLIKKDGDKYLVSRYGNPNLKWETTTQYNIGLDAGFLKNRLYLTADYFWKTTSDILLPITLPKIVGDVQPTIVNAGEVSNEGFELGVTFRNSERAFKYNINANVATVKNEVKQLHPNLPSLIGQVSRTVVGQPLNAYYGYVFEGIYQNEDEIASHLFGTSSPTVSPGDIRFKDMNEDGKIDDNDRDFIGDPNPGLLYGLNLSGSYKGFDLALFFQGVGQVDRYNDSKKIVDYDTRPFNYTTEVLGSWDGEGSTNAIPRVSFTDNGSSKVSSIFVEDASYFRLKNVELGYSFNSLHQVGIKGIRVYVSAQNVFTLTSYSGLDPESTDLIDMGTYPQARSFIAGINLNF